MSDRARSLYRRAMPPRLRGGVYYSPDFRRVNASARTLAAPGPARAWLALIRLLLCVKHELPWEALRRVAVPVWITAAGRIYLSDWSELLVAVEVFGGTGDYDLPGLPPDPSVIVDLGANIGLSARFFSRRYPRARIVAYEPDPRSFATAERNLRGLGLLSLRNLAVAATAGTLRLHRLAGESWRTSTVLGDQAEQESFTAGAVTLDSIIEELERIDILKIDIEGGEYEVVAGAGLIERLECIVGELHPVEGWSSARFYSLLPGFELLQDNVRNGKGTFLARRSGPDPAEGS
jgi:FkbM family methyltransferase